MDKIHHQIEVIDTIIDFVGYARIELQSAKARNNDAFSRSLFGGAKLQHEEDIKIMCLERWCERLQKASLKMNLLSIELKKTL